MARFYQSSPHLSNQFKLFPVRLAEFYNLNITDHDYELDDTVQGISLAAFLPILVIFIVAIILFVFIKCKKWRRNRDYFKKLRKVYDALEILDLLHENENLDPLLSSTPSTGKLGRTSWTTLYLQLSRIDKALVGDDYEAGRDLVNRDNMIKYDYSVRRPSTLPILNESMDTKGIAS